MNKEQIKANEPASLEDHKDVKQNDIAWSCIEDLLNDQDIPEYDFSVHKDEYAGPVIYQESKYYDPFADTSSSIV